MIEIMYDLLLGSVVTLVGAAPVSLTLQRLNQLLSVRQGVLLQGSPAG